MPKEINAAWNTYTDPTYGYTFNYPKDWKLVWAGNDKLAMFSPTQWKNHDLAKEMINAEIGFSISTVSDYFCFSRCPNVSLLDELKAWKKDGSIDEYATTTFAGVPAYSARLNGNTYDMVYIDHNNSLFVFSTPIGPETSRPLLSETGQKILDSFTFLSSSDGVSWRTYDEYNDVAPGEKSWGFSFNYPSTWNVGGPGVSDPSITGTGGQIDPKTTTFTYTISSPPESSTKGQINSGRVYSITLVRQPNPENLSAEAFVKKMLERKSGDAPTPHFEKQYATTVGAYDSYELYGVFGSGASLEEIYWAAGDWMFSASFPISEPNQNYSDPKVFNPLAHKILSSFKFIQD